VTPAEPVAVLVLVTNALEALGVPYFVGGSMASAVYGIYRATADADVIADLRPTDVEPLIARLQPDFYVDGDDILDAITHRRSFNAVHLATMFKVDVFILRDRDFDREQMRRRQMHILATSPERAVMLATSEDTVLAKLEWYRRTGGASDRQWADVIGILRVRRDTIDLEYLRHWAVALGLADVLERALIDAVP
jgi:hypothetical protein